MKQKINARLLLIAILAVIATTVGITTVYYNLFQTRVKHDLSTNAELLSETGLFQELYLAADGDAEKIDAQALVRLNMNSMRITWIASDGTVLYDNDTDATGLSNHLDRPEIQSAIRNGSGESVRRSDTKNTNTFYYALRLENGTILRVSTQARSISNVFRAAVPVVSVTILMVLAACILIGHLLTLQLIRPINVMAEHLDDSMDVPVYRELEPYAERIRAQHEKILESAAMRQDFTANVSHELKTPITAISGYAELLENGMVPSEQGPHVAQQIRENAERLMSMINDIIKLSELDHTEIPRVFESVDLYELAKDCCRDLQINAQLYGVSLTCTGSETPMKGDRELLKEMLENLIQNAIRYNRTGGFVKVGASTENGHAVLKVEDNGIGIPKEQQEHVFERFYRVDKSRSRETGGTGLGLAIVKHIAEMHNAEIVLESALNSGTDITVRF